MKYISLLLSAFALTFSSFAQRTIQMKNLWVTPQVHVVFQGYTLSFTIKDINRALELLLEAGDTTFGTSSGLDTAKNYIIELYPGLRQEYHNHLQYLMQKGIGAFLLDAGHAIIENPRHKKVKNIETDIKPLLPGVEVTNVKFYDPVKGFLIFEGMMEAGMYNKDLGIDY